MDWSDTGFVVAKGLFREADVWLRILFRGHGMQTVFAFGGAHSRRRFVRSARPVHGAEALFFRQKRLTSCGMYSKNILFHGLRLVFRRRTGARQPRP